MKNRLGVVMVAATCCVALSAGAQQAQTPQMGTDGKMMDNGGIGRKVAYDDLAKANKIIGMDVKDPQEHYLGKVKDLAVDLQGGRIAEVIVGTGGFVGLDEKMIAVPPESLAFANKGKELKLADADVFKTAPLFKFAQWNDATTEEKVAEVYQRFHVQPHANASYLERADKIMGLTAKTGQNQHLGKVDTLVVDLADARVVEVIIASGGFLGMDDELSAVPPQAFKFVPAKDLLTLDTSKAALKNAPHFKARDWRSSVENAVNLSGVYNAYNIPPYFTPGSADTTVQNAPPQNAGDTQSDVAITGRIHQIILATDGLSADARNVQVSTLGGRVTLRGTAESEQEKRKLGDLAAMVVASDHVDNQISVRTVGTTAR